MSRILIVDDEVKICEFIKACLESQNYLIDVAYTGKDALNLYEANTYDLIILDRMLPDLSGGEICRQIRMGSEIPIIMLTAKIEDED